VQIWVNAVHKPGLFSLVKALLPCCNISKCGRGLARHTCNVVLLKAFHNIIVGRTHSGVSPPNIIVYVVLCGFTLHVNYIGCEQLWNYNQL